MNKAEKADLSAYSTDEPDSSTAIEEADSPDSNSSGKSTGEGLFAWEAFSGEFAREEGDFPTQSLYEPSERCS
jgi:hypothetical protein